MKWFNWRESKWGAYTFAACAAVLLYVVLEHLGVIGSAIGSFLGFFLPVIYGAIMAYVMDFFVKFIEQHFLYKIKSRQRERIIAVIINTVFVVLLFVLLVVAIVPQVISSITGLVTNWDSYVNELTKLITRLGRQAGSAGSNVNVDDINKAINNGASAIADYVAKNSDSIIEQVSSIGTKVLNGVISFIIAIYFLIAKDSLLGGIGKLFRLSLKGKAYTAGGSAFQRINGIFSRYIVCEIVDAAIIGVSNAVFMTIARMPYIALISVVVGVTNLAPTFGPIVGGVIGSVILLLVHPTSVIPFIIFTIILQTIDGYVIKPKMYGTALSVPSVWILVAIIVLGRMFGVVGILLAIPVAAIITYWIRDFMAHSESKKTVEEGGAAAVSPEADTDEK